MDKILALREKNLGSVISSDELNELCRIATAQIGKINRDESERLKGIQNKIEIPFINFIVAN